MKKIFYFQRASSVYTIGKIENKARYLYNSNGVVKNLIFLFNLNFQVAKVLYTVGENKNIDNKKS